MCHFYLPITVYTHYLHVAYICFVCFVFVFRYFSTQLDKSTKKLLLKSPKGREGLDAGYFKCMYLLTYMIFVFFCVYFLFVFPKISSEFQHFYFLRNVKDLSTISEKIFFFYGNQFSQEISIRGFFFRTSLKLLKENFKENFRTIIYLPTTKCIVFYSGNESIH